MIFYYNKLTDNNLILSIDNVVLDFSIASPERRDLFDFKINMISKSKNISIRSWDGHGAGSFRKQYIFALPDGKSFWLGQGLIGNGVLLDRYRLEYNPNKLADDPNLLSIREFLIRNSRSSLCRVTRFDLAIDIPVEREKCFLIKDRRMYIERRHGKEFTQYLGSKSSTVGRVKLYNKQIEAGLDHPLTRLELTLDPAKSFDEISFPQVYYLNCKECSVKVSDTDRFILNALLQGYGALTDLGRKTRTKMQFLLNNSVCKVEIAHTSYSKVLNLVNQYVLLPETS